MNFPSSQAVSTAANNMALSQAANTATAINSAALAISSQQQFIINSFRGQIYISDQLDVQDTPLYDTWTLQASQTINDSTSSWFTNVANNSGKTLAQTNMTQNGVLEAPEAFAVFGCRIGWSEGVLRSDLQTMLDSWAYQLTLGKKPYQQGNIRHYSSGWGISGYTTRTSESFYTNGVPSPGGMNLLAIKLVIANQMSFSAKLTGFTGQTLSGSGSGMILTNELVGLYARGVQ